MKKNLFARLYEKATKTIKEVFTRKEKPTKFSQKQEQQTEQKKSSYPIDESARYSPQRTQINDTQSGVITLPNLEKLPVVDTLQIVRDLLERIPTSYSTRHNGQWVKELNFEERKNVLLNIFDDNILSHEMNNTLEQYVSHLNSRATMIQYFVVTLELAPSTSDEINQSFTELAMVLSEGSISPLIQEELSELSEY